MNSFLKSYIVWIVVLLLPFETYSQSFADKQVYLIDSLILDDLSKKDKSILDSCLVDYHKTQHDTDKINAIFPILEKITPKYGLKYAFFQAVQVQEALKNPHPEHVTKRLNRSLGYTFNEIARIYSGMGRLDDALRYVLRSLKKMKQVGENKKIASCLMNISVIFSKQNKLPQALEYGKKAIAVLEKLEKQEKLGMWLSDMARLYEKTGDIVKCRELDLQALILFKEQKDTLRMAHVYNNIGRVYGEQLNLTEAVKYFEKSLALAKRIGHKLGTAAGLNNIGRVYLENDRPDEAFRYFLKSFKMAQEINDKYGMAIGLNNLGRIASDKGYKQKALLFFNKSLKLHQEIDNKKNSSQVLVSIGNVYLDLNRLEEAEDYLRQSIAVSEESGHKYNLAYSMGAMGKIYAKKERPQEALSYLNKSLILGQENNSLDIIKDVAEILGSIYKKQNNDKKALEMYHLHYQMADSISATDLDKALVRMENRHALITKDQQIELLSKEKKLNTIRFRLSLIIYIAFSIVLITSVSLWFIYKKRKFKRELNALRALKLERQKSKPSKKITSIHVTVGKKIFPIPLEEIVCFRAENNYVFLVDLSGKSYIVDYTLTALEKVLPKDFVRIHRSYIINTSQIQHIAKSNRGKVVLTMKDPDASKLNSSVSYAHNVSELLENLNPN